MGFDRAADCSLVLILRSPPEAGVSKDGSGCDCRLEPSFETRAKRAPQDEDCFPGALHDLTPRA